MESLDRNNTLKINSKFRQTYAVWEITLKCNLACGHCGSRAGDSRVDELSTEEALDLVQQMADLGIKEVTLIGGEAFMRPDWLVIAAEITKKGMKASMTTGGYGISLGTAKRMKAAGITNASVSIDGLEEEHDALRGKVGSFQQCFKTLKHLKAAGITTGCNSQINRKSARHLFKIYELIRNAGVSAWQLALTVPMGNAVENSHILLQPYELLDIFPMLAYMSKRGAAEGVSIQMGNNIGAFGPYERLLKETTAISTKWGFSRGCAAGINSIGIEADGSIKGCPSLPSNAYTGGNIRERTLADIYSNAPEMRINEMETVEEATKHLWGDCKKCEFASVCRSGCNWTAHVFFGKRGNNPYCHHRALKNASMNKKEKFVKVSDASGLPFDHGTFEVRVEDTSLEIFTESGFRIIDIDFPESWNREQIVNVLQNEKQANIDTYKRLMVA